ncbi:solanesyl-diphosphate synthase 1, mitochondrial isoform X2 [Setaria italica]|uniref:solanesyl-diphosphate synthase 1, mitochondrial isoform X2 n=1 Tax=Setaria italica TaxID=4555 RepID=UPI00035098D2|nr:solanesyl-diphosphate synthase 1, mitochondrial isoform X2 [Setaria italica]
MPTCYKNTATRKVESILTCCSNIPQSNISLVVFTMHFNCPFKFNPHVCTHVKCFQYPKFTILCNALTPPSWLLASQNMCYWDRFTWSSCYFHSTSDHSSRKAGLTAKEQLDPFVLIKDEVSEVTDRLRSMVVAEVPELTSAAGYFFRAGAEGKRTCPTVLLLMASAISMGIADGLENKPRARHMHLAEITEMIHISSLIHDDVLDDADTRRGMDSLNFKVGKKFAVLAGDFLLFRAFSAAVSLDNTEVVSLLATAVNNLVTGELMQMSITPAQRCRPSNTFQKVRESRGRGPLLLNMQNWQRALSMIFLIVRIKLCLTRGKRSKILLKSS